MRHFRFIGLVAAMILLAGVDESSAQIDPYTFEIQENASGLEVSGAVLGLDLRGDRSTAIGGSLDLRVRTDNGVIRGFIIDGSIVQQLDPLEPVVPNFIPFLPPLEVISINHLSLEVTTGPTPTQPDGSFLTRSAEVTVLSGVVSATGIVPFGPLDLTGASQTGLPLMGTLTQEGDVLRLSFPLNFHFDLPEYSAVIDVRGQVLATAMR